MAYGEILYEVSENICCITLNRPKRLNAVTPQLAKELRSALREAAADDAVRVIVLTGAGRGFCAGADLAELEVGAEQGTEMLEGLENAEKAVSRLVGTPTEEELDPENRGEVRADFRKRYSYLLAIPKPVIAAINGPAAGLGLIYALFCDLRFACASARFSTAFSRRGLIAEHGVSWMLSRIVGLPNSLDLLLSARLINADEAFSMGLVNKVFPDESFMESVMAYARELATSVSPRSMRVMKRQLYEAQFCTLAEVCVDADRELVESIESEDFREGVAHFLEKRIPQFTGR